MLSPALISRSPVPETKPNDSSTPALAEEMRSGGVRSQPLLLPAVVELPQAARLAEAERQLTLADAALPTDPVEALDAIRRAVMHARDADALARY